MEKHEINNELNMVYIPYIRWDMLYNNEYNYYNFFNDTTNKYKLICKTYNNKINKNDDYDVIRDKINRSNEIIITNISNDYISKKYLITVCEKIDQAETVIIEHITNIEGLRLKDISDEAYFDRDYSTVYVNCCGVDLNNLTDLFEYCNIDEIEIIKYNYITNTIIKKYKYY